RENTSGLPCNRSPSDSAGAAPPKCGGRQRLRPQFQAAAGFSLEKPAMPDENSVRATHPMNLDSAPRLNKAPFILTAAVCFAVFLLIGLLAPNRFNTVPLVIAVTFLLLSIK